MTVHVGLRLCRTGISKAYGGALSALSITYTLTPVLSTFNISLPPQGSPDVTSRRLEGLAPTSSNVGSHSDVSSTATQDQINKGKGTGQWIEREEVVALYPGHRMQLVVDERQIEGGFW